MKRLIFAAWVCPFLVGSAGMSAEKEADGEVVIREDGDALTRHHLGRTPFIYPLPSPSGANLARNWPMKKGVPHENTDHPHHRSLWFTHGAVNDYDFWAWQSDGEPEIIQRAVRDLEGGEDTASFTAELDWVADGKTLLTEVRRHEFERPDEKTLLIRLTSELTAARPEVVLGDTKEGTFGLRVDRTLRHSGEVAEGGITNSEGLSGTECWGKRARWVAFHGPDELGEPALISMMDHPDNLRHPTWWHARDYGLLAANPFGIHDFEQREDDTLGDHTMKEGETLTLRYQLVLHHGEPDAEMLEEIWNRFAQ